MQKTILMTGATGYLGSHIAQSLLAAGDYRIVAIKRRASSLKRLGPAAEAIQFYDAEDLDWDRVFGGPTVDAVLHCATNYGRRHETRSNIVTSNLVLPLRLLEECATRKIKAFINTDTMLDKGVSTYGLSKNQFKEWLALFSGELLCVNVVLEHFFGPRDDPSKFVTFVLDALRKNAPSLPLTLGEQKRDFIYIDDVVSAFHHVLDYTFQRTGSTGYAEFPIGTGHEVSIAEFVALARTLTRSTTRLDFGALPYRPNEPMHVKVDVSRIRGLGWRPRHDLHDGLLLTLSEEHKAMA